MMCIIPSAEGWSRYLSSFPLCMYLQPTKGRVRIMTRAIRLRSAALIMVMVLISSLSSSLVLAEKSEDEQLAEIRRMIEEKGYHWTAGKTSVSGLSDAEKAKLLGYIQPSSKSSQVVSPIAIQRLVNLAS